MIFKPKFFLDLSGDSEKASEQPAAVVVAPVREKAAPAKVEVSKPAQVALKVAPAASAAPAPAVSASELPSAAVEPTAGTAATPAASAAPTTAEAIAAELAAAQANRPAPSLTTFAPEALVPGGANPQRRRRGGANLAGFRAIARSFVKN
jgi:hypothetical protein